MTTLIAIVAGVAVFAVLFGGYLAWENRRDRGAHRGPGREPGAVLPPARHQHAAPPPARRRALPRLRRPPAHSPTWVTRPITAAEFGALVLEQIPGLDTGALVDQLAAAAWGHGGDITAAVDSIWSKGAGRALAALLGRDGAR